jgi:hypothetical protein
MTARGVPRPQDVHRQDTAGFVYGTLVVVSVVTALSVDPASGAGFILSAVLATAAVFWIAHVYASTLQVRLDRTGRSLAGDVRATMVHEASLLEAALLPSVPLLLATLGVLERDTGILLAQIVGLAELFLSGYTVARVLRGSTLKAVLSGIFCLALGAGIIALKALLH